MGKKRIFGDPLGNAVIQRGPHYSGVVTLY